MALNLNSVWLFLFITANKYIRILLMPNCAILLTDCCLHAVEHSMLKDSTNREDSNPKSTADRLAVRITGVETEKILGIVKLTSGTGAAQASATFELLKLWTVSSEVMGMSFDTTASNTGSTSGACTLLEHKLQRNLLHFACRHHIHELIIGGVFTALLGPNRSPNIALFEQFQRFWSNIDQHDYKPLDDPRQAQPFLHQ